MEPGTAIPQECRKDHPVWEYQAEMEAASDRFCGLMTKRVLRLIADEHSENVIKKTINKLPHLYDEDTR